MLKKNSNKLPIISIITVVLNGEKTLKKCIQSVINQSYPQNKIEYIVIDGGSRDRTISIIKKYAKKISYWHSKKDRGLYDAMNKGIKKSSGEIIGILNADDFYYKNALYIVKKYFENKKIDFLFGTVRKDRILHGFWPKKINWKFNIYPSHSGGFFIRRKAQKKIGYYNLKFKYSSDRDLIYRMIKVHKLRGICTKKQEVLSKFDVGGISSRVNFFERLIEEMSIRLHNKQNIFFIILLFLIHIINKIINLIFKK